MYSFPPRRATSSVRIPILYTDRAVQRRTIPTWDFHRRSTKTSPTLLASRDTLIQAKQSNQPTDDSDALRARAISSKFCAPDPLQQAPPLRPLRRVEINHLIPVPCSAGRRRNSRPFLDKFNNFECTPYSVCMYFFARAAMCVPTPVHR